MSETVKTVRNVAIIVVIAAAVYFLFVARSRMWETGFSELAWWVLLLGVLYTLLEVFRHSRTY